jgi:hypothetical protein
MKLKYDTPFSNIALKFNIRHCVGGMRVGSIRTFTVPPELGFGGRAWRILLATSSDAM